MAPGTDALILLRMIAVVQRVLRAQVAVEGRVVGRIGAGMVVLAAVEVGDTEAEVEWMAGKLLTLRMFRNGEKHFDWDVGQVAGNCLETRRREGTKNFNTEGTESTECMEADEGNLELGALGGGKFTQETTGPGKGQWGAGILLVSNFTVAAETAKGRRPSLSGAAVPERGREMFDKLVEAVRRQAANGGGRVAVETGEFGAMMEVELVNDGPVTFIVKTGAVV